MERLTEKDGRGNWQLKGLSWESLHPGEVISKPVNEKLYGALCKLKDYEDTDLAPDEIEWLLGPGARQQKEKQMRLLEQLGEFCSRQGWVPVEGKLPEDDRFVLMSFENFSMPLIGRYEVDETGSGAFYVGDDEESCSSQDLYVNAWMPLPDPYRQQSADAAPEPPVQAESKLEDDER